MLGIGDVQETIQNAPPEDPVRTGRNRLGGMFADYIYTCSIFHAVVIILHSHQN